MDVKNGHCAIYTDIHTDVDMFQAYNTTLSFGWKRNCIAEIN